MGLKEFFENRTGLISLIRKVFLEKVRGGARWAYVFGSCLVFLFALQVITGIVMALHYSASSSQAWGSVAFFQENLRSGWLIRGLHHWAASFIVIFAIIHLFQVFLFGAYQRPKEFNWWSGVLLLLITLGMALTGYLLPWDQRGYWSTNVVTNIIGTVPILGPKLREILIGGRDFGSTTLTHFYGLHVLILPGLFFVVLALHLFLFRRHGVTPGWWRSEADLEAKTEPFWPRQVFYDLVFSLLVLAALGAWTIYKKGAPLGPPADPVSNYLARPEWYFLFLFQSLKYFKGGWEVVGTLVLPSLILIFLLTFPFLDRHQDRTPGSRPTLFVVGGLFFAFLATLTLIALNEDRKDPIVVHQRLEGERQAQAALSLAKNGIPPSGPLAMIEKDPLEHGRKVFAANCMNCHALNGLGGKEAPDLTGYFSEKWLKEFLRDPQSPQFYGRTSFKDMMPLKVSEADLDQLVGYLRSLSRGNAEDHPGLEVYKRQDCQSCHGIPGKEAGLVLDLTGFGSSDWLKAFLEDPAQERFYGTSNQMPGFKDVLKPEELDHLIETLRSLSTETGH